MAKPSHSPFKGKPSKGNANTNSGKPTSGKNSLVRGNNTKNK